MAPASNCERGRRRRRPLRSSRRATAPDAESVVLPRSAMPASAPRSTSRGGTSSSATRRPPRAAAGQARAEDLTAAASAIRARSCGSGRRPARRRRDRRGAPVDLEHELESAQALAPKLRRTFRRDGSARPRPRHAPVVPPERHRANRVGWNAEHGHPGDGAEGPALAAQTRHGVDGLDARKRCIALERRRWSTGTSERRSSRTTTSVGTANAAWSRSPVTRVDL